MRVHPRSPLPAFLAIASLVLSLSITVGSARAVAGGGLVQLITSDGTGSLEAGADVLGDELIGDLSDPNNPDKEDHDSAAPTAMRGHGIRPPRPLPEPVAAPTAVDGTTPGLVTSFNGLNHRQQRLANGGNQFSLEPPDQGLCAGNGFVLETVNDVMRVFSTGGAALSAVKDLNTFYGYPPAFNRTTGVRGPFVTDPVCYFDADTQRWYHLVLTLDRTSSGGFAGTNHLDLAVSTTPSPLGTWKIYRIHVEDNGTLGQPDHHCSFGFCLGDYPKIAADANGLYITTNEFSLFGPEFIGAQLYATGKVALAAGASSIAVVHLDGLSVAGIVGYTVLPALTPAGQFETRQNGTQYFLSSLTVFTSRDNRLALWSLTNTASLNTASPAVALQSRVVPSEVYNDPPRSNQKAGDFPLGQCVNDTTTPTPFGPGCWRFLFGSEPSHTEVEGKLDSGDSRMLAAAFSGGVLYGALDTLASVNGQDQSVIAWFAITPVVTGNGMVVGSPLNQGYLAVAGNNLLYPSLAVLPNGKGVLGFTLSGNDFFPTAAYTTIDAVNGTGTVHVAGAGLGTQDGFSEYKAFRNPPRPRWGDYGWAIVDGGTVWLANEFIAAGCTLAQYMSSPFGSCGGTRTSLANWATRISNITP